MSSTVWQDIAAFRRRLDENIQNLKSGAITMGEYCELDDKLISDIRAYAEHNGFRPYEVVRQIDRYAA